LKKIEYFVPEKTDEYFSFGYRKFFFFFSKIKNYYLYQISFSNENNTERTF